MLKNFSKKDKESKAMFNEIKGSKKRKAKVISIVATASVIVIATAIIVTVSVHNSNIKKALSNNAVNEVALITEPSETTTQEITTIPIKTTTVGTTTTATTQPVVTTTKPTTKVSKSTTKKATTTAKSSLPSGYFHNKLSDSQNAQALAVAQQIANSIGPGTDLERVKAASYKVNAYVSECTYSQSGSYYSQAYGVFVAKECSCAGATRALGLVLSIMGYKWEHINEGQYTHQWCKVWMDGQVGWGDAFIGLARYGDYPEGGAIMITQEEWTYKAD